MFLLVQKETTMSTYFNDKQQQPTDDMLAEALGETKVLLDELIDFIETEFGECRPEWKYYGNKYGWSLKLFNKKRNVLFVGPEEGYFNTAFAFGEKTYEAIMESKLPAFIKDELRNAPVYVEGRPLRMEIKSPLHMDDLKQLVVFKLRH
jgi:hypothetical protein